MVRIMTHPNYNPLKKRPAVEVLHALGTFAENSHHEFCPDDISLTDSTLYDPRKILGSRQITDLYLLSLATKHCGRFVTFDQGIHLSAAVEAKAPNLYVIC
jgi:uncharacterized protein